MTVIHLSDLKFVMPDFCMEPENLWTMLSEIRSNKDIDFQKYPEFSKMYYLRSDNVQSVKAFFTDQLIGYLQNKKDGIHLESHRNRLLIYYKLELLSASEITGLLMFIDGLIEVMYVKKVPHE